MKIIKWLVIIFIALLVIGAIGLMVMPKDYAIERSITIDASPDEIHAHVEDLQEWPKWMSWWEQDETIKTTYGDPSKGVGATSSWTSEKEGGGEIKVTASDPKSGVKYDMFFIMGEGDDAKVGSKSEFVYEKAGEGTKVTWKMNGEMPGFFGGLIRLAITQSAPTEFDKSLAKLKKLVEDGA